MPDTHDDFNVKVGDFGLAKLFPHEGMRQSTGTYVGTPGYAPPEILNHEMYSFNVDVWTLGVCTYIILCGCPPFPQNMKSSTVEAIRHADRELHFPASHFSEVSDTAKVTSTIVTVIEKSLLLHCCDVNPNSLPWHVLSLSCQDFMRQCMDPKASRRPGITSMLEHEWMQVALP